MVRWSYGYRYLLAPEDYKSDIETQELRRATRHRHPTMESDENTPLFRDDLLSTGESRPTSNSDLASGYEYSTAGTSPIDTSNPFDEDEEDITSFPSPQASGTRPWHKKIRRFLFMAWREFLEFMNMPLWAMLVAILIALFPALQHYLFFQKNGFIRGSVIYAIQTCGDVSIPLILVILGANIANDDRPALETSQPDPTADRKCSFTRRQRGIILGVATRLIIVPVCPFLEK